MSGYRLDLRLELVALKLPGWFGTADTGFVRSVTHIWRMGELMGGVGGEYRGGYNVRFSMVMHICLG